MRSLNHAALPLARATQITTSFELTESYGASALQVESAVRDLWVLTGEDIICT
jgi:hypothetical protein